MIDVLVEPEVPAAAEAAAAGRGGVAVVSVLPGPGSVPGAPAERVVVDRDGVRSGTLGDAALGAALVSAVQGLLAAGQSGRVVLGGREVFVEVFAAPPRLVVVGAGSVAVRLVALARELGYRTVVVDARGAFATSERFPLADEVIVGWPDEVADRAGIDADAFVAVLTHDPKVDDPVIALALRRGGRNVGALGSRRTQAGRLRRLRELGLSEEEARLHGPIGLDLGGRTPVEIALAIMAEIVAVRRGGSGGPLTEGGAVPPAEGGAVPPAEGGLPSADDRPAPAPGG